ncbi:hypothetical protein [Nonomuraea insulae]|uniref:Uncharacterized protein n=1 Tax=Nonomuraea insulae TaxID=1616787 RepID=A0ABW1D7J6_9ACTN
MIFEEALPDPLVSPDDDHHVAELVLDVTAGSKPWLSALPSGEG